MTHRDAPHKAERYDYQRQAWIGTNDRYLCCAHPPEMHCTCYGRLHAGELAAPDPIATSCGRHYPNSCPSTCPYKGDRFSRQQIDEQQADTAGLTIANAIAAAVYGPEGKNRNDPDAAEAVRRVDVRHQHEQEHPDEPILDDETGQRMH